MAILPHHDKPTIIKVTTDWLLQHEPLRHRCASHPGLYNNTYRNDLDSKLKLFLKTPRTTNEMTKHCKCSHSSLRSALKRLGALNVIPGGRNQPGTWRVI